MKIIKITRIVNTIIDKNINYQCYKIVIYKKIFISKKNAKNFLKTIAKLKKLYYNLREVEKSGTKW